MVYIVSVLMIKPTYPSYLFSLNFFSAFISSAHYTSICVQGTQWFASAQCFRNNQDSTGRCAVWSKQVSSIYTCFPAFWPSLSTCYVNGWIRKTFQLWNWLFFWLLPEINNTSLPRMAEEDCRLTVISGRLPAGNALIFQWTAVAVGNRKVRVMWQFLNPR